MKTINSDTDFDVAISGAGPAGASAAYWLSKQGYKVLLVEKQSFPRDKACGDGLIKDALQLLHEMGLQSAISRYQQVDGVQLIMDNKEYGKGKYDDIPFIKYGIVIPRRELDNMVCQQAVEAGATLWHCSKVVDVVRLHDKICGLCVIRDGKEMRVYASWIIAADGGNSLLARKAKLYDQDPWSVGYALRGYYTNIPALEKKFVVYLPMIDPFTGRLVAGYGWVFPLDDGCANIGVGFFPSQSDDFRLNVRHLMQYFIDHLRQSDARFTQAHLQGRWLGAPLNCRFTPDRCSGNGIVLVGDAAGLVDPFTGEGISCALKSGKLAAQAIGCALQLPQQSDTALPAYHDLLKAHFKETFQMGKSFVKSYGFLWKLMEGTLQTKSRFFKSLHQVIMNYDVKPNPLKHLTYSNLSIPGITLEQDLALSRKILVDCLQQNPLIAKLSLNMLTLPESYLRPALLLLSAGFGDDVAQKRFTLAASMELAYLAFTTHHDVLEKHQQKTNWGNMFTVLTGDFFLIKSFTLLTEVGAAIRSTASFACDKAVSGQIKETQFAFDVSITEDDYLNVLELKTATFYQYACMLGGEVGGASSETIDTLARVGRYFGLAYGLMTDVVNSTLVYTPVVEQAINRAIREGIYTLPIIYSFKTSGDKEELFQLLHKKDAAEIHRERIWQIVKDAGGIDYTLQKAKYFYEKAEESLFRLADIPERSALYLIVQSVMDTALYHEKAVPSGASAAFRNSSLKL